LIIIAALPVRALPERPAPVRLPAEWPGQQARWPAALPERSRWPAGSREQQASWSSTSLRMARSPEPIRTAASRSRQVR